MPNRLLVVLLLLAATAGLFFASYSTFDFVQHLDRQVHDIHCSFVPGLAEGNNTDQSGCQVTMMSPYSSMFRTAVWGGLPVSLPAMAVFAFLLFRGVDLLGRRPGEQAAAAGVILATAAVALLATVVMGTIAFVKLHAACKLCIGIYTASFVAFVAAIGVFVQARRTDRAAQVAGDAATGGGMAFLQGMVQLGIFVAVPAVVYLTLMPDYSRYIGTCGNLTDPRDPYGVMVDMDDGTGQIAAIEVFDPLCPACRAFEERLHASGLDKKLQRKAVLFPLDDTCNWMVDAALHPGACTISEAVLCANDKPGVDVKAVIQWAFDNQERILETAAQAPEQVAIMAREAFPALGKCIGSAGVRATLNKSLRWAVANEIPVLTPQLYLDGAKLCDEDTDLGMDYALSRMIERHQHGGGQ